MEQRRRLSRSHKGIRGEDENSPYFIEMPILKREPPTNKQIEYMEILFNDTLFTREQRNAWLSMLFHRSIGHLDQLYKREASNVIEILQEMKESK